MNVYQELKEKARDISVLCVDDDTEIREEISTFLEKFFKSVESAENGTEALVKYKKNRHDILITDIKMPGLDGISLFDMVKELNPNIQHIIISGFDIEDYFIEALIAGVQHYIKKPVDNEQLIKTLLTCIDQLAK